MTQPDTVRGTDALEALVIDRERRHADAGARFLDKLQAEIDAAGARRLAAHTQLDDNDNFGL